MPKESQLEEFFSAVSSSDLASMVALVVSITALIYTVRSFSRKQGAEIRSFFTVESSIYSKHKHVSNLTLENMKDRSIAIFNIYLQLGLTFYVELESREKDPIILEPFGTYSNQYDPVDFYSVNMRSIDLAALWTNKRQRIVLSTSDGKYVVKDRINRWFPVVEQLRRHNTAVILPMRTTFDGKGYGSEAIYVVAIEHEGGEEEVLPLYPQDHQFRRFRNFKLSRESLESEENLDAFLRQTKADGLLTCKNYRIHDLKAIREERYKDYASKVIQAESLNWFEYFVLGRVFNIAEKLTSRHKNRLR